MKHIGLSAGQGNNDVDYIRGNTREELLQFCAETISLCYGIAGPARRGATQSPMTLMVAPGVSPRFDIGTRGWCQTANASSIEMSSPKTGRRMRGDAESSGTTQVWQFLNSTPAVDDSAGKWAGTFGGNPRDQRRKRSGDRDVPMCWAQSLTRVKPVSRPAQPMQQASALLPAHEVGITTASPYSIAK